MNQLSPGPHDSQANGPDTAAGTATAEGGNAAGNPAKGTSEAPLKKGSVTSGDAARNDAAESDAATYDAVAGPFTIRDLTVFGSTLLMFVASLLPMFGERYNLWNLGNLFFLLLGILLPLVVVALFVARRLQPGTIVRIGSLSVDQFASVAASFAFPLFFLTIANSFNGGVLLGLVGSVGLLAATVLAPHLPWLSADFKGRAEKPAHVVAREAAVPSRKPAAPKAPKAPKAAKSSDATASTPGFQASATGYQAPASHVSGTAAAAASTGASPFAPPASYGTTPSPATEASAVVHSADAKPAEAPGASPASSSQERTEPVGTSGAKDAHVPAQGSLGEPATTQHAAQPATTQHAAQQAGQAAAQQPWAATMATPIVSGDTRRVSDTIGATVDPASRPEESDSPQYEAFWFAVAQPRTAYDERTGAPAFTIEPGGWVLALEDRGHEFLVQDTDGKVGVLRELSNIERG
ncbi:hypothetical protein [Paenarthrobacter aurescens]|uniref:Uncharacterized protein n=1 Tax=Paenarthrobacter aurescens TaxID=43663 RepID=A0A4Y3NEM2_PAEAU|nr:hypothetical protein [Paenarthrobacter aurescens]MDO6144729.1 hypothetical protein [Paenarthrobacter aurescens]MDO6148573.1 hypothetical protein [Paenarthrobacter aurescens]MDO6159820.1 hypothetical protein [Paenarthrobacter aurescens]MDO6163683.1 hypothetical protein [Paenarthrobacter aurescens]GEB17606.1 hypothetical protein AAU01_03610 [Paenarthrobacter aurescens]